jgi:SAM-dependent methyltransferase
MTRANFIQIRLMTGRDVLKQFVSRFPRLLSLMRNIRSLLSSKERAIRKLQRNSAEHLLQPSPTTKVDRHPALFTFVQKRLAAKGEVRILSFGCSTGEEPLSLASYLPDAIIDAVDINPRSIAIARRRAKEQGINSINFRVDDRPPASSECYDAVFCLSVLREGRLDADQPDKCTDIFPFSKFEATVAALDRNIRPGGVLLIWGSNFHFAHTAIANRYCALKVAGTRPHCGAFYGANDVLLGSSKAEYFVFEKLQS